MKQNEISKNDVVIENRTGNIYQVVTVGKSGSSFIGRLYRSDKTKVLKNSQVKKHPFFKNGLTFLK